MKYLLSIALCVSSIGCVYEKGYNPTFWDYVSVARNSSGVDVDNFRVSIKGHDRLMINEVNFYSSCKNCSYAGKNIPIRGIADATWSVRGINYSQKINLSKFNIRSYKDANLVFEMKQIDELIVYLEKWVDVQVKN